MMDLRLWSPWIDREFRFNFPWVDRFFEHEPLLAWRPYTDMYRENGLLIVKAELPGIDPDKDVKITVEGDMLVLSGEKLTEKEVKEPDRLLRERIFGHFERRIPLPDKVDPEAIKAVYEKGVLTIKVPLPTEVRPKTKEIPVSVG
jgi:HSP20 family protein